MNKGQIFSIDMLFGIIVLIFGVGLLIGAAELNFYNSRQTLEHNELIQKAIIGAEVITNYKEWDCNLTNTHPAYSINKDKLRLKTISEIKQKANLTEYNIRITIDEEILFTDSQIQEASNLTAFDLNILTCNDSADFNSLRNCIIEGEICSSIDQNIKNSIFKIEVAK